MNPKSSNLFRKVLGIFLSVILVVTLMPSMSVKVKAAVIPAGKLFVAGVDITTQTKKTITTGTTGVTSGTAILDESGTRPVLKLNNFQYKGNGCSKPGASGNLLLQHYALLAQSVNIDIELTGNNKLELNDNTGSETANYGVYFNNSTTISGTGSLEIKNGASYNNKGLYLSGATISGVTITVNVGDAPNGSTGILSGNTLTIQNSTIKSTAGESTNSSSSGIDCTKLIVENSIIESHGNRGNESYGITSPNSYSISDSSTIIATADTATYSLGTTLFEISRGSLVASGHTQAVYRPVKNTIKGVGWTDTEGTTGKTPIDISETARELDSSLKKVKFPGHDHSLTYSASSAVITATCANTDEECDLTGNKVDLTIVKPARTTYGGTESAAATLTGLSDFNSATGKSVSENGIKYYKATKSETTYTKTGDALAAAPTNAGDYVAELELTGVKTSTSESGTVTASVGYTIVKKAADSLTEDEAKAGITIDYTAEKVTPGTGFDISLNGTDKETTLPASITEQLNGDAPKIYVRRAETDDVAAGDWVAVSLVARPDAPTGLSADGASTATTTDGKINGTTSAMEYSEDNGATWVTASDTATPVKAGTYLVRIKATTDAPAGKTVEITVDSKQIILADDQKPTAITGLIATGSEQTLLNEPERAVTGGTMNYAISDSATIAPTSGWSTSIPKKADAGTYHVWYKAIADADHLDSEPGVIDVTISDKPEVKFDVTTMELSEGGTGTITATVVPSDATITWKSDSESVAKVDSTGKVTAVGAGTAKITATITVGTTEYKAECTVTVTGSAPSETVPEISISDLSEATEGEAYNQTLTANGAQPITWAITAGSLPDGLALGSDTGVISGTPTSTGTSVFTVTASNSYGSVSKELSITVQAGNTIVDKEGTAPYDEKTSVENDPAEVRALVSGVTPVDESDTVRLILNTDSKDEGNLSDDEKEAVDTIKGMAEANGLTVGSFVDLTLIYEVTDANGAQKARDQIKETSTPIKVKFPIPPGLRKSGRLFSIFRFHDSGAEIIGTGSGDAVDVDTNKFSMYAIAYEDGAAPAEDSEKKVVRPHTHTYAWDKVEATEDRNGELRYQCTECYDILVRVPLSAYYVFNANTVDKITKAKQGETVKITTDRWISFHKMVFDALAARPDVSLEVSFLDGEYKGNRVSFTIPAGADSSDLFTENNFAGFMYLGNKYGLKAEEK
ncbi:Putative Ig domain-containing protein [Butyrivibrio sp. Su6]|uniref:putative Ig domain-containing protein n=1 Tax=Butyrivibrio sp. Su6 TaxID=1520810 RepID=UPI00089EBD57|nr:putative Ig domain-containing protein [Butyrivibrio sp. Su6]SEF49279.1 Putative Ig domain-containing protein [Butyrivibrio sp. Su6]